MSFEVGLYLNVRILLLLAVLKVDEIESHEQRQQKRAALAALTNIQIPTPKITELFGALSYLIP
ncbi:hypothetical protein ACEV8D_18355 [Vibrio parahaemolyticus]